MPMDPAHHHYYLRLVICSRSESRAWPIRWRAPLGAPGVSQGKCIQGHMYPHLHDDNSGEELLLNPTLPPGSMAWPGRLRWEE